MSSSSSALIRRLNWWLHRAEDTHNAQCEALPLRRDIVTVLIYVRDHKVVGTQSTGNFPLKVVREVTARFVDPPVLDTTIGDRTYRLRSEDEVWPLVFAHALTYDGGLLTLGGGRRWQLTPAGVQFLASAPLFQVWLLLATWWETVDWVIAFPVTGMAKGLPNRFKQITLADLLSVPVEVRIPYEPFADKLIEETGFRWSSQDPSSHRAILHGAIRRMVIRILTTFEILESEYQDVRLGAGTISQLVAFRVTPFGRDLLKSLTS
jgi:hypothetical protein